MCSDNCGATEKANGVCEECGQPTVDGYTKERCAYSPRLCDHCEWTPCDGSC